MPKKLPCQRLLLTAAAVALCALGAPSLASAASWAPIGTTHVLDSSTLLFVAQSPMGALSWDCTEFQLHIHVKTAADSSVTDATFPKDCHGTPGSTVAGCTVTPKVTGLPWTLTAPATNNIQIHNVDIDFRFEHVPPAGSACAVNGLSTRVTGTLTSGNWHQTQHEMTLTSAHGLVMHSVFGTAPVTVTGTLRDTTQTLTVI